MFWIEIFNKYVFDERSCYGYCDQIKLEYLTFGDGCLTCFGLVL